MVARNSQSEECHPRILPFLFFPCFSLLNNHEITSANYFPTNWKNGYEQTHFFLQSRYALARRESAPNDTVEGKDNIFSRRHQQELTGNSHCTALYRLGSGGDISATYLPLPDRDRNIDSKPCWERVNHLDHQRNYKNRTYFLNFSWIFGSIGSSGRFADMVEVASVLVRCGWSLFIGPGKSFETWLVRQETLILDVRRTRNSARLAQW